MHIAVACGGTGGHVFPGLSVARVLRARGHLVTLWLAGGAMEGGSVAGWDGPVETVRAFGFPSGLNFRSLRAAIALGTAFLACRRRMRQNRPDAVLAMGSYASVGPVLAACSLHVPVVLHEANAVPGRAVTFLSRFADVIALSFESTVGFFAGRRTELTGFPARTDLDGSFEPGLLRDDHFRLLVMGGSQGAHALNILVSEAVVLARERGVPVQVIHLSGPNDEKGIRSFYEGKGVPHMVFGFLREIGKAYQAAHFAIARSGAGSCAELAACGVPALFIPLPASRRDHQVANARDLESAGAASVLLEQEASVGVLADRIERAFRDAEGTAKMRAAMRAKAHAGGADRIATVVERAAAGRRE